MQDYKTEIQNIRNQIVMKYNPERIILFGSVAKNNFNDNSDIDILVVKRTNKSKFERMCELRRMIDYDIPLDILVYTPEELELALKMENDFLKTIYNEGVVLYEQ